jgi:hypothetical protein
MHTLNQLPDSRARWSDTALTGGAATTLLRWQAMSIRRSGRGPYDGSQTMAWVAAVMTTADEHGQASKLALATPDLWC